MPRNSGIKQLFENSLILAAGRKPQYAPVKTAPVPIKVNSLSQAKQRKASAMGRRKLTVAAQPTASLISNEYSNKTATDGFDAYVGRGGPDNVVSTTAGGSMHLTMTSKEPLRGAVTSSSTNTGVRTIRVRKTSQVGQPVIAKGAFEKGIKFHRLK